MVDLNSRIPMAVSDLVLIRALAVSDNGSISADSSAGLVLWKAGSAGLAVRPIFANDPVVVGATLDVSARFTGTDVGSTHTAAWSWGDGSAAQAGLVTESSGIGRAIDAHNYSTAGICTVKVTLADRTGRSA